MFLRTFLERDLPLLGVNVAADSMRRFWTMLAHHHGQLRNASEFGRSFGVAALALKSNAPPRPALRPPMRSALKDLRLDSLTVIHASAWVCGYRELRRERGPGPPAPDPPKPAAQILTYHPVPDIA